MTVIKHEFEAVLRRTGLMTLRTVAELDPSYLLINCLDCNLVDITAAATKISVIRHHIIKGFL